MLIFNVPCCGLSRDCISTAHQLIDPQREFSRRINLVRFAKSPIEAGIDPVRLFLDKSSVIRDLSIPTS
ncbi:hypothetical protein RHGRI_004083 [Rhododendron griersonianum]|nr:hypothetical protein RHGRI_004083 [Rhododendron griersonianum]